MNHLLCRIAVHMAFLRSIQVSSWLLAHNKIPTVNITRHPSVCAVNGFSLHILTVVLSEYFDASTFNKFHLIQYYLGQGNNIKWYVYPNVV